MTAAPLEQTYPAKGLTGSSQQTLSTTTGFKSPDVMAKSSLPNSTSAIEVRLASLQDKHIIDLSARQRDEILLTDPDLGPFTADIPTFIILVRGGEAIACGGLRLVDEDADGSVAEIKRVYVVPEARGQANGISDFLLKQLELHAVELGWKTLRLQTNRNMFAANRLYERHGYGIVPNYGEYVDSPTTVSYEKAII